MEVNQTVLKDVFEQGQHSAKMHELPNGGRAIVLPQGATVKDIPAYDPPLLRINQSVIVHDAGSFVEYLKRFKTDATRIFAEPGFLSGDGKAHLVASIDYHEPDKPKHKHHMVVYTPRYSEQWTRWQSVCDKPMGQAEFAELIEETRADIREPNAASLMDIVRAFKANKKTDFDSLVYQPNSGVKLHYSEKVEQTGESGTLPEVMKLGIPVYFRDEFYAVPVFIRYRVGGGGVTFQLKLDRDDVIEDEAFNKLVERVSEMSGVESYLGKLN